MANHLPNFIFDAIYRSKSGRADASASAPRFKCYTPASPDIPKNTWVADCWVCDAFGRVDPGLNVSPIPVRKEDLGPIVNTIQQARGLRL